MNTKPNLPAGTFESSSFHPPRGLARNGIAGVSINYKRNPAPWAKFPFENDGRNEEETKKLKKARYKAYENPPLTCWFSSSISIKTFRILRVIFIRNHLLRTVCGLALLKRLNSTIFDNRRPV